MTELQSTEISTKLQALGLSLPETPKVLGTYIPALEVAGLVYVSGQLPMRNGSLAYAGRVGVDLSLEEATAAAQQCFLNCLAALKSTGKELHQVKRVVRLVGHVQCGENFHDQPKVLNGASDLCKHLFGDKGTHTRVALGAFALPLNAAVELEAIFAVN